MSNFGLISAQLKKLGFKVGPVTKSKKFSMTFKSNTAVGYISIRYDSAKDVSTVIAEFYGRTKSKQEGIGGSFYMVRVIPKLDNVTYFRGYNEKRCQEEFAKIGRYMMRAVPVFVALSKF